MGWLYITYHLLREPGPQLLKSTKLKVGASNYGTTQHPSVMVVWMSGIALMKAGIVMKWVSKKNTGPQTTHLHPFTMFLESVWTTKTITSWWFQPIWKILVKSKPTNGSQRSWSFWAFWTCSYLVQNGEIHHAVAIGAIWGSCAFSLDIWQMQVNIPYIRSIWGNYIIKSDHFAIHRRTKRDMHFKLFIEIIPVNISDMSRLQNVGKSQKTTWASCEGWHKSHWNAWCCVVKLHEALAVSSEVFHYPNNPWDWYIYLHENHILPLKTTIHVGKYTSPMDLLGYGVETSHPFTKFLHFFRKKHTEKTSWKSL